MPVTLTAMLFLMGTIVETDSLASKNCNALQRYAVIVVRLADERGGRHGGDASACWG